MTDASVKSISMREAWIFTNTTKSFEIKQYMYIKQWEFNTLKTAEDYTLLNFVAIVEQKGRHIKSGKIKIMIDNQIMNL